MGIASPPPLAVESVLRARAAGESLVRRTPLLGSQTLSEGCGGDVVLKAESLQRTGAFKLRGALAKIAALGPEGSAAGVVCGSAGNHAQSLAFAARARGIPCEVFMPAEAPVSKVEGAVALGAEVHGVEGSTHECVLAARERAEQAGLAFVHPFDDLDVIAGQATLGLELLEDVPDLTMVVVPVGGGGLASGIAATVKSSRPGVRVVGVQVEGCASFPESLRRGEPVSADAALTIADGIAIKRPGELTLPLVQRWVDELVVVGEDDVAEAMVHLLERAKLVVEGAGAVGVAALLAGAAKPAARGATVVVLTGGNVDAGLLAAVARRHETEAGRRVVLLTRISDQPGGLAVLLTCIAQAGANLVEVQHVREGLDLHVRETAVQVVLETRGREHAAKVLAACAREGYDATVVS